MSKTAKIALWVVVAAVLALGAWWYAAMPQNGNYNGNTVPPSSANGVQGGNVSAQGNTDAALNQNLSAMSSQMNGFSSDSASMDQGLNDQPIQQSY
ncbi:MAG TPA: hypothetical protein VNG29_03960 [Candidatus Paceibacterota bacterium]|nr:hypothetical protein [Candidatus Paceibacterota bacterium]